MFVSYDFFFLDTYSNLGREALGFSKTDELHHHRLSTREKSLCDQLMEKQCT